MTPAPFHSPREARRLASGALMKWISIASVCALAVLATACEKHPASDLPREHGAGEHHAAAKGEAVSEGKPAEHAESAKADAAKPEGEAKPGEAPKFFPETK